MAKTGTEGGVALSKHMYMCQACCNSLKQDHQDKTGLHSSVWNSCSSTMMPGAFIYSVDCGGGIQALHKANSHHTPKHRAATGIVHITWIICECLMERASVEPCKAKGNASSVEEPAPMRNTNSQMLEGMGSRYPPGATRICSSFRRKEWAATYGRGSAIHAGYAEPCVVFYTLCATVLKSPVCLDLRSNSRRSSCLLLESFPSVVVEHMGAQSCPTRYLLSGCARCGPPSPALHHAAS